MRLAPLAIGAARLLLETTLRKPIRRDLRRVFFLLDQALPGSLHQHVEPSIVEDLIADAIKRATGITATDEEVTAVAGLFDPRKAMVHLSRRPRP